MKRLAFLDACKNQNLVYIHSKNDSDWLFYNNKFLRWEFITVYNVDLNTKFTHFDLKMNFDDLLNLQNKKILLAGKESIRNPA